MTIVGKYWDSTIIPILILNTIKLGLPGILL